jgi:cytochrome c2
MRQTSSSIRKPGGVAYGASPLAIALVLLLLPLIPILGARRAEADSLKSRRDQPFEDGRHVFEQKGCANCHAVYGGEDEQRIGPDLGRSDTRLSVTRFAGSLWNHAPAMLASMREQGNEWARISPGEMQALTSYVFYVRFIDKPGNVTRGGELFDERMCSRCHQFAGRGGTIAPRLDELKDYMSSFFLTQALWNHGPGMAEKMRQLRITRPRLDGAEVTDIVAFLRGGVPTSGTLELAYIRTGSPRRGRIVFEKKGCIRCHAVHGKGGSIGPELGIFQPNSHVSKMAAAFWNHGVPMWAKMKELGMSFPRLTNEEMSNILAYFFFSQPRGETGNPEKGARIYREKSCSLCHALGGEGTRMVPDLRQSVAAQSAVGWTSAMWNHLPAMRDRLRERQVAWPRFENSEMRDLVAFIRSRSGGK